jgi:glycosyltransferase involved in cell wall biosynthesis
MRLCMLNDNYYRASGITLSLQRLVRTPDFAGMDVFLAGCQARLIGGALEEDLSMVPAGQYERFDLMTTGPSLLLEMWRFVRWLRTMQIDVLHVHHRRLAVLAQITSWFHRVPVLFTGHLTFAGAAWFRELSPRSMTGVSPSVVEYLLRETRATDVSLIYNAVDFSKALANPHAFRSRTVISAGRLEPVKGYDKLIEAWSLLKADGVSARLEIFGEGSLHRALQEQVDRLGLQENVFLMGFSAKVCDLFPSYAFQVLVSEKEGFPNAVVEAAAHGIPSLLTNVDGSRDALVPGLRLPNGIEYGDVNALRDALRVWLESPEDLREDGGKFRDQLRDRTSPEVVGRQFSELYARLINGRSS